MAAGGEIIIELSYPLDDLSPNARVHHMALHRAKKKAKEEAYWATKVEKPLDWAPPPGRLPITITFHPVKGKAAKDIDNALACEKARIDGISEALKVNDKLFDITPRLGEPKPHGGVTYEIAA